MTEEKTLGSLAMAVTSALPLRETSRAPRFVISRYKLMRFFQHVGTMMLIAVLSLFTFFAFSHFLMRSIRIVGISMVPTLQENGSYLLNMWVLHYRNPQRGEIVVIRDPGDHGLSIKRVIAAGGDSILFKEGSVYVNGKKIKEPYLGANVHTFTYAQAKEQFITCGKDQYFVLGDNRFRSIDSRSYGPVSREDVLGLVNIK